MAEELVYGKPRIKPGHRPYGENEWTQPRDDCPHPEHWHCLDGDSTEVEVTELVAAFVRATQPEFCIETGSAFGDTTVAIGKALTKNGHGRLVTLEPDGDRADMVADRCRNLPVTVMCKKSEDFEPVAPIDFAWFDSLIELRVAEFLKYRPKMNKGAIVGFHDCGPHRAPLRYMLEALMGQGLLRGMMPKTPRGVCFAEVL